MLAVVRTSAERVFAGDAVVLPLDADADPEHIAKACAAKAVGDPRWLDVARDAVMAAQDEATPAAFSASADAFVQAPTTRRCSPSSARTRRSWTPWWTMAGIGTRPTSACARCGGPTGSGLTRAVER